MNSHDRSDQPCNLCGGVDVDVLSTRDRDGAALRTVICCACGLVYSDPVPVDVHAFYSRDYRVAYKGAAQPTMKRILRAGDVAIRRLRTLAPIFSAAANQNASTNLLDIGSGGGEFLYLMRSLGLTVRGIEPNPGYGEFSRREYGLDVDIAFVQAVDHPPRSFDLVTMWHVLEHTDDPLATLQRVGRWLGEAGILVVEVPNVEATCQTPGNTFHIAHLYNLNHTTLAGLAAKAGLRVLDQQTSRDGGNITQFLQPAGSSTAQPSESVSTANYRRITAVCRAHTNLRYYLSTRPYLRLARKLVRSRREKAEARAFDCARELLDTRYAATVASHARLDHPVGTS